MNPYGAVPAALEQTRLTLRDIMAGYVNQKIQESKLNLAQKQMEVEARALELEGEKQKAQTEFNLARIAADTARQDKSYDLEQEKFGHSQEMDRLRLPLVQKQIETAGVQAQTAEKRLEHETYALEKLKEKKPLSAWADEAGLTKSQKEVFMDLYGTTDGPVDSSALGRALTNLNNEKPLLYSMQWIGNRDKIEDIEKRLADDVNLTAPEKTALTSAGDKLKQQNQFIEVALSTWHSKENKLKPTDIEKIQENAASAWDILSKDARASYAGGYKQYEKEYVEYFKQDVMEGLKQIAELRKKDREKPAGEKPAGEKPPTEQPGAKKATKPPEVVGTLYTKYLVDRLNEIETYLGADASVQAQTKAMEFIKAGDLRGAQTYLDNLLSSRPAAEEVGNRLFRSEPREPAGTAGQGGIVRMPIPKVKR
jgi:hypothetical protein